MANGAKARYLGKLAKEKKARKQAQSFVGFSERQVRLGYALDMQYAREIASVGHQRRAFKLINRTDERGNCLAMKECDKRSNLRLKRKSKLFSSGSTVVRLASAGFVLAEPRDKVETVERTKVAKPKTAKRGKRRAKSNKAKAKTVQTARPLNAHEKAFKAKQERIASFVLDRT